MKKLHKIFINLTYSIIFFVVLSMLSCAGAKNKAEKVLQPQLENASLKLIEKEGGQFEDSNKNVESDSIKIGNYTRSFLFHVPAAVQKHPNLIFVLHGSNGTGADIMQYTEYWFNKLADQRNNAIIVYPNGYKKHWNECRKEANFDANLLDIDDIQFFEKMIDYFSQKYSVNRSEVFVTGHSNGGHMVFKLAKERPNLFKKFAAVSASLPTKTNDDCSESKVAVSMMVLNGTSDPINPYEGGEVNVGADSKRGSVISTFETMQYWAKLAKLDFANAIQFDFPDVSKDDETTATMYSFKKSKQDIRLIEVKNGGHLLSVPTKAKIPAFLGKNSQDINMAAIIYDYFLPK